jgi:hypothetical protein
MNPCSRHQLNELDRALLALLDERARLISASAPSASAPPGATTAALDDLLRRRDGPTGTDAVRRFFAAIDEACEPFRPRRRIDAPARRGLAG